MTGHAARAGLANLRTLTGSSEVKLPVYKAYLRVSFLELERTRHSQEIATASARLHRIITRCKEIDKEKAAVLAAAGERSTATVATPGSVPTLRKGRRQFGVAY
jgi:hypothetical protein